MSDTRGDTRYDDWSVTSFVGHLSSLDDWQLANAVKVYLQEGSFAGTPVYPIISRDRFIQELFNRSDTVVQERIRKALTELLERFDGTNPTDNSEYLFYLVSLVTVIRSAQAKERLRRWIRQSTFSNWSFDQFNLSSELILATSAYDSDEDWVDFLLNVLPKRRGFKETALATYRALFQARGVECVSILPDVLLAPSSTDAGFTKSLGYLLRTTIDTVGAESFCKALNGVLSKLQRSVEDMWLIVLRLEEIMERELGKYTKALNPILEQLGQLWNKGVVTWNTLPAPYKFEAFDKILDAPERNMQVVFTSPVVRGAFKFREQHFLEVSENDTDILERSGGFFDEIGYDPESVYRRRRAGERN